MAGETLLKNTSDTITASKSVSKIHTLRQGRITAQTRSHRLEIPIIEAAQEHKAIEAAMQAAQESSVSELLPQSRSPFLKEATANVLL